MLPVVHCVHSAFLSSLINRMLCFSVLLHFISSVIMPASILTTYGHSNHSNICFGGVLCAIGHLFLFQFRFYDIIFHSKIVRPNLIKWAGDVCSFGLHVYCGRLALVCWKHEDVSKVHAAIIPSNLHGIWHANPYLTSFDIQHQIYYVWNVSNYFKQTANKIWPHPFHRWSLSFSLLCYFCCAHLQFVSCKQQKKNERKRRKKIIMLNRGSWFNAL